MSEGGSKDNRPGRSTRVLGELGVPQGGDGSGRAPTSTSITSQKKLMELVRKCWSSREWVFSPRPRRAR